MLTELDVDVLPRRARGADVAAREQRRPNPYPDGLPPEVAEAQARFYGRLFRVIGKHSGVATRVTFWGPHDGASWLNRAARAAAITQRLVRTSRHFFGDVISTSPGHSNRRGTPSARCVWQI